MAHRRNFRDRNTGPSYRKNNRIRVPEVRLIDEEGEQAGVVNTQDAKRRAQEAGLDLVEVAPNARPPVCKIMDYGKFMYQQRKKDKKNKTGVKGSSQLKELRVRPAIDTHDLDYRLDNGRRFLEAGHKVQVVCIFRGRQMAHPEHGSDVMRKVSHALSDISKVESPSKMMGRRMTMLLTPLSSQQRQRVARDREDGIEPGGPMSGGQQGRPPQPRTSAPPRSSAPPRRPAPPRPQPDAPRPDAPRSAPPRSAPPSSAPPSSAPPRSAPPGDAKPE